MFLGVIAADFQGRVGRTVLADPDAIRVRRLLLENTVKRSRDGVLVVVCQQDHGQDRLIWLAHVTTLPDRLEVSRRVYGGLTRAGREWDDRRVPGECLERAAIGHALGPIR